MNEDETQRAFSLRGDAVLRTGNAVRAFEAGKVPLESRGPNRRDTQTVYEVVLLEDLLGTDDPDVPTSARARIKVPSVGSNALVNDVAPNEITVLNRSAVDWYFGAVGVATEIYPDKFFFGAPATSSGSQMIAFSIVSSDPAIRSALVEIRQRSFAGPVYGSTLDDTVVTVYDTDGCYLNEPNVDLTGRNGHAELMLTDAEAESVHFPDYDVPPKYWKVIGLCCPNTVCE